MTNDTAFYGDLYHPGGRECGERTPHYLLRIFSVVGALKGQDPAEQGQDYGGMIHGPAPEVRKQRHRDNGG